MLKEIFKNGYVWYASDANRTVNILEKIPYAGRKVSDLPGKVRYILGFVFRIVWEILKKIMITGIVMYVPYKLFSKYMPAGDNGFGLEDCFVYFAVVLIMFCTSINNSAIFKITKEAYASLKELKCNPRNYFRVIVTRRSVFELVSYTVAFTVFGMGFVKALYMSLLIVGARFAGDTFNILVFRITGRTFEMLKGGTEIITLTALLFAYFMPYVRGYVPGAYDLIFDSLWLGIILIASVFFAYYVWNYGGYVRIAGRVYVEEELREDYIGRKAENPYTVLEAAYKPGDKKEPDYEALYKEFFAVNRGYIFRNMRNKFIVMAIVAAVVIGFAIGGRQALIYKIISYSMLMLPFVVFAMSTSDELCRRIYYQCDIRMFHNDNFLKTNDMLFNYFRRLKSFLIIDIIPCAGLTLLYLIAGIVAGKENSADTVAAVCVGILILGIFFCLFNILFYYAMQPYNGDYNRDLRIVNTVRIAVCVLCTGFIKLDTTAFHFTLGAALALAVIMALSVTLVWKFGKRTFRDRQ